MQLLLPVVGKSASSESCFRNVHLLSSIFPSIAYTDCRPLRWCPGLNNVIREIVNTLHQSYGIGGKVYGIQGGFRGFYDPAYSPIVLTPHMVESIHHEGGTVLGSSRGGFDLEKILDFLDKNSISNLYVIGGDGTHRGAFKIHEACMEKVSKYIANPYPLLVFADPHCDM